MGWGVPKSIAVTKLESCHSLLGEGVEVHTQAHSDSDTDTHTLPLSFSLEACSSTSKVTELLRTHEEVRICTGLSYKEATAIPFRWDASVPRSKSGNPAFG